MQLAKAEIHVHLEGSMPPALAKTLAKKNNMRLSETLFADEHTYAWRDFIDFLNVYDKVSEVIQSAQDYHDVAYAYLAQSAAAGVVYCELMPSPDHAAKYGVTYPDLINGIAGAITRAKETFGIEAAIYVSGVRHFGPEQCAAVARLAVEHPHPMVVGYGLGGDELGFPPQLFKETYTIAASNGLGCTIHAGEWAGPKEIAKAIELPGVTRLGHGIRCIEDLGLVREIVARGITLEVCPTSNIVLGVYPDYDLHPMPELIQLGVKVSLNSDDPPFFNTSIGREYQLVAEQFGFSPAQCLALTKNSIDAGFIEAGVKAELLTRCVLPD
jgi:adenosine deaminase